MRDTDDIPALVKQGEERAALLAGELGPGFTIMVTTCAVIGDIPYEGKRPGALYAYRDKAGNEVEYCIGDVTVVPPYGQARHYWWD